MDYGDIYERSEILRASADGQDRSRIRAVMNGGALGVQSVLNWGGGTPYQGAGSGKGPDSSLGIDLPTANIMYSGLERLAQSIGREPSLKTDMIPTKDSDRARDASEKRGRIVRAWDETTRMELQYPQIGRWLPGYGFTLHAIRERMYGDQSIPVAELRDPYDVYPGMWGVDQQPTEVAVYRHVSRKQLAKSYPHYSDKLHKLGDSAGVPIIGQSASWEGNPHSPVTLIEYMCGDGTYVVCPEVGGILSFIPNPLTSGPAFVMTKRFSFDQLQGHFVHTFGLMAMMAKLNLLGLISVEDANFRETNIIGTLVGDTYERGRGGINVFEPGSRVERPTSEQAQQTFAAIQTLERQFRVVSGYNVAQDGQSPNSFATGQGIRELGSSADNNVREYQTAIKHSIELIDRKRLEWEEKLHAQAKKKVFWYEGSSRQEENYVPAKDIKGDYRTNREYGAMATFDENSKIIAGLQLLQARIIDRRTLQDNLDGLKNPSLINERIDGDQAKEMLIGALGQRSAERDPAADMALVQIMDKPGTANETLKKIFTPEEPQMSPEEAAMAAGQGQPGAPGAVEGGPPPGVQTILSQMEAQGGGVQTVGQL